MTKTFTIENETNNITAHSTAREAKSARGAERFATASALAGLATHWPSARLVGIWNTLPGATPVRKFKDRATAVSRIWKAIQNLDETVPAEATARQPERIPALDTAPAPTEAAPTPEATPPAPAAPPTPGVAPEARPAKIRASRAKPPVAATKKGFREASKTQTILNLLNRPGGATLQQIMQATNWQAHSVRGFISGTVGRKMSLTVLSVRSGDGERSYSLQA